MNTLAARITDVEKLLAKLIEHTKPQISQVLASPPEPNDEPTDIAELQRQAALPGMEGKMAAGWLRVFQVRAERGLPVDPGGGTGRHYGFAGSDAPAKAPSPCPEPVDPLVEMIDHILAQHGLLPHALGSPTPAIRGEIS